MYCFHMHLNRPALTKLWSRISQHWLMLALVILCAVFTVSGVIFYGFAQPPRLDVDSLPPPATVDVFVSDPSTRVELTIQVGEESNAPPPPSLGDPATAEANRQLLASIYIAVVPPILSERVQWVVEVGCAVTNADRLPDNTPPAPPQRSSPSSCPAPPGGAVNVFEGVTRPGRSIAQATNGILVGNFVAQPLEISRGNLVIRMPDLAPLSYSLIAATIPRFGIIQPGPVAGVPAPPPPPPGAPPSPSSPPAPPGNSVASREIVLYPGPRLTDQMLATPDISGGFHLPQGDVLTKYYVPQTVISKDQLNVPLTQYQPLAGFPSNPSFAKYSVAWQGAGELSPALTAIGIGISDARSNDTFISGVTLAIAAGALIALLQELGAKRRHPKPRMAPSRKLRSHRRRP
jgi:hypothetical protein